MYRWTLKTHHDTETLDLFDPNHGALVQESVKSTPGLFAMQQEWPPMEKLLLTTNGPTFASLGVWDGS